MPALIADYTEEECMLPMPSSHYQELYQLLSDKEEWNWKFLRIKMNDPGTSEGKLIGTMLHQTRKTYDKVCDENWKNRSMIEVHQHQHVKLVKSSLWSGDFGLATNNTRIVAVLFSHLPKPEIIQKVKTTIKRMINSKRSAEHFIENLIEETRQEMGIEMLKKLSFSREGRWFKDPERRMKTVVDVVAHLTKKDYKNPRHALDRLVQWHKDIPANNRARLETYKWVLDLVMPETPKEAEVRLDKERIAKKKAEAAKKKAEKVAQAAQGGKRKRGDHDMAESEEVESDTAKRAANNDSQGEDATANATTITTTTTTVVTRPVGTPTIAAPAKPTQPRPTAAALAAAAPPEPAAEADPDEPQPKTYVDFAKIDIVDLTAEEDQITATTKKHADAILQRSPFAGPNPKKTGSTTYLKPADDAWIAAHVYKFQLANHLATDLAVKYGLQAGKRMKKDLRVKRAAAATRKLGFLGKRERGDPPLKIEHINNSVSMWLHELQQPSFVPTMVFLESVLGQNCVGVEALRLNYKKALSAIQNRGYDDEAKKVLQLIIEEVTGQTQKA
ncbi:unknown protein [Seminavis robusta]|uniref:Uncharacterized protein n=1 Tax=Seminavis robusta TaxID=568900 RepID=A0A9N8HS81_9STRA|nr:unknown protein [Seminavis robusta]|eukprot:Sro1681_g290810.1 n/a (559) ;mRNA; f:4962-6638